MKKLGIGILVTLLLVGCTKKEEKVLVIHLDKKELQLFVTDTYSFTVKYGPVGVPAPEYQWSSSNNSVATISGTGLLTAVGEGSATITVVAVGTELKSVCEVTVAKRRAAQIKLDKERLDLKIGERDVLYYTLIPSNTAITEAVWESSNEAVAVVEQSGIVTAVAAGEATVTVYDKARPDIKATCAVHVSKKEAEYILLNKEELTLTYDQEEVLTYTVFPGEALLYSPLWVSANPEIAKVDQEGKVTGKTEGYTIIKVYSLLQPSVMAFCEVTVVRPAATTIVLNKTELTLEKGGEGLLTYTSLPEHSLIESVVWSSSDVSIVSVDQQGKVTGKAEGIAQITVSDVSNPNLKATCVVTVTLVPATGVRLSMDETDLFIGDWITLQYVVQPQGSVLSQPEWRSDNPQIASVDQSGKVTGLGQGTAVITIVDNTKPHVFATCTVKVFPVEATSIQLDKSKLTIYLQEIVTLPYQIIPSNTTDKAVEWSSDDREIATVDAFGKVTARTAGSCNITVKLKNGSLSATCQVEVVTPVSFLFLDRNELNLVRGNRYALKAIYFPESAVPPTSYRWSSSDEWTAFVGENGTVEALRIGSSDVKVEIPGGLSATCSVNVAPRYDAWKEPLLLYGSSLSQIRREETRSVNSALTDFAGDQAIVFNGETNSRLQYCVYTFVSNQMIAALLAFADNDKTAIEAVEGFCAERYKFILESDGIKVYEDRNGTHIEVGYRNLTEYVELTASQKLAMAAMGLKDRWFIISYSKYFW